MTRTKIERTLMEALPDDADIRAEYDRLLLAAGSIFHRR